MTDDPVSVGCDRWQEVISAVADGEPADLDPRLVDAHVARCPSCAAFRAQLDRVGPGVGTRLRVAETVPDLAPTVVRHVALADRARSWRLGRVVLAVVAVEIVVLSIPELVLARDATLDGHSTRHLGAFSIAYAVALMMVVWRPARARTILPVAAVLAGALLITAIIDTAEGRVPLSGEALHLPELLSVPLVWALAVPTSNRTDPGRRRFRRSRPSVPSEAPALRVVDDTSRRSV